jgi:hypothetical protein
MAQVKRAENLKAVWVDKSGGLEEAEPQATLERLAGQEEGCLVVAPAVQEVCGGEKVGDDGTMGPGGFGSFRELLKKCSRGNNLGKITSSGKLAGGLVILAFPLVQAFGKGSEFVGTNKGLEFFVA